MPRSSRPPGPRATAALALVPLLLAACASPDPTASYQAVGRLAQSRLGPPLPAALTAAPRTAAEQAGARERAAALLAQPLQADTAVQLALLQHRGLQADLAELGLLEASLAQELRWPNPGFSLTRLRRGGETEIERGVHLALAQVFMRPWVAEVQAQQRRHAQTNAALQVLTHTAQTRRAWVQAVAAGEQLAQAQRVLQAAEAAAVLAQRMQQAGNFSPLQAAREERTKLEATLAVAQAQRQQLAARESLARWLGLDDPQAFTLPESLPALPEAAPALTADALQQRLDLQAAQAEAERTAGQLGLVRRTRFINVLELGVQHNSATGLPPQRGVELRFELPLFDWGDARVAQAEARYMQALHRAAQRATEARSELRQAQAEAASLWEAARVQRDALAPLQQHIAQQQLLRYNGMLIDVFALLAEARAHSAGTQALLAARRDFWLADVQLELARLGARGPDSSAAAVQAGTPAMSAPLTADAH